MPKQVIQGRPPKQEKHNISGRVDAPVLAEFAAFVNSKNMNKAEALQDVMVYAMRNDDAWEAELQKEQTKRQIANNLSALLQAGKPKKAAAKAA